MKFLFEQPVGGEIFRIKGFMNALMSSGHECYLWNNKSSAYDAFDNIEPDVFVGTTFNINKSLVECISERPNLKVILKGSNFGSLNKDIDLNIYPIVSINTKEYHTIKELYNKTGRPNFIFCHYHENDLERTMGLWEKELGIKIVALPNAADILEYDKGTFRKELASDISFVGGYWPYKAVNIDKYLIPLCAKNEINIKIWGNQPWFVTQYLGIPDNSLIKDIYCSAKVCPNISEPHSTKFGFDVVERPFKILSSGGFCLMDDISGARHFFNDEEVGWYNENNFEERVKYYLNNQDEAKEKAINGRKKVLEKHTYHNRCDSIFENLV